MGLIEKVQLEHNQCGTKESDETMEKHAYEKRRRAIIKKWLTEICKKSGREIVDVGCGHGTLTKSFTKKARVYGLDINEKYLHGAAENNLIPIRLNISQNIALRDNFADAVVASEIIEHGLDPQNWVSEFRRILKPGGKLILTTPNLRSLLSLIYLIFRDLPCPVVFQPPHIRFFTFKSMIRLLKQFNFSILNTYTNEVLPGYIVRYFPKIGKPLCKLFDFLNLFLNKPFKRFGFQIIILAKKE